MCTNATNYSGDGAGGGGVGAIEGWGEGEYVKEHESYFVTT